MIWVTLSEPSANTFAASLVAAGFPVLQRPVTRIRPLPVVFAPGLETPRYVICLSRHAAEQYAAHYDQNERLRSVQSVVHVAIGATTAYPLRPIGCPVVLPASASSEGILDLPQLADLASEDNVWLLTGVAGVATVQRSLPAPWLVAVDSRLRYNVAHPNSLPSTSVTSYHKCICPKTKHSG